MSNDPSRGQPAIVNARRLRRPGLALVGCAVLLLCIDASRPAEAAWPPPVDATSDDMKNPVNWPNDPGYGYVASDTPSERESGLWQFYSFIPDRSPGSTVADLRPEETASGMSIDLAWRHTIGDDSVLIAVLDSGIKWEHRDLVDRAYLNKGELAARPPLHADGSPCAPLDPAKPTEDLFDCNGDGILSVSDYADHPDLNPAGGDANANGVFDAGDLIIMKVAGGDPATAPFLFSDGIDNDGNGYVDDISGWDFMKNDNDPYDDTRYGHGTGEANDSTAEGNNGIGDIGVCPRCRFVPLRVGDSFIADVQDFSKAVVYATDNGASVIQEALGTINMSAYAQKALDYAWSRGTVVVASMADENARHHNMPGTANHTMPVHAIAMLGKRQDATTAESFLAFNTCTNFGAQNYLSASGTGCSSEAVGRLSGMSGLVYSMGVQSNLTPPLSAGEVLQLFLMTADDIDIEESRTDPESGHFWSQPGFDQRFGYGRVNANTAVEAVKAGRIPPEVDVVRPYWFEVLYADQVTAPVPIMGTVSARRATSFDYVVEWAPGVQPLDGEFEVVHRVENIPASTTIGADGEPLAELDIRAIDVSHERDVDSPMGENDYTITVRVRAMAHYGGEIGEVPGELRRAYYVYEDPDLLEGFPLYLGASGEASPKLADIDGDGIRDIVVGTSNGKLHVYSVASGKPEPVAGFPFKVKKIDGLTDTPTGGVDYRSAPAYATDAVPSDLARESLSSAPAIADIDGDGKNEIVITTWDASIYAVNHDGTVVDGWPVRLPAVPSCPLDPNVPRPEVCMDTLHLLDQGAFGSPVLEDMNGDGSLDIVQTAFDGKVYIFDSSGNPLPGWPVLVHHPGPTHHVGVAADEYNRILSTPAVADFNGDGTPDVVVGSSEKLLGGNSGAFYAIDGRGNAAGDPPYLPNWPIGVVSLNIFPLVAEGAPSSPVAADLDGDGKPETISHGNGSSPLILPGNPGKQERVGSTPPNALPRRDNPEPPLPENGLEPTGLFGPDSLAQRPDTMFPLFAQPSVGDLNQDGTPDVITAGGSLSLAQTLATPQPNGGLAQLFLAMWDGKTGAFLPGAPVLIEDFSFFNSQTIADVSGDGYPEVLAGSGGYYLHAVDACGREAPGWPKFTGQWIIATPPVGDIDGDDTLEVVVNTRNGWLYAWHTQATTDSVVAWESYHHDNRNTGNYQVPLEQGRLQSDAGPLPLDEDGACIKPDVPDGGAGAEDRLEAKGGCGCSLPRHSAAGAWLAALALVLALGRRRRRR